MNKNLMLTVNVIAYNHEKWIAQCLDSILAQKTSFKFVIRIFEDCSTDNTAEICRQYKEKYPDKIELYLSNVNLGATKNGLRSYENIQSPYYMFIESDDYIHNNKRFQMQVDALEKHKDCSFCCGITVEMNDKTSDLNFEKLSYLNEVLKHQSLLVNIQDPFDGGGGLNSYHCTPILEEGIYSQSYFLKYWNRHAFSYLVSRIVRTDCICIDKAYPGYYLTDFTQFYELLQKGNMLYFREIFGVSRHTGTGIISGLDMMNKFKYIFSLFYQYNDYTNKIFQKNILNHLSVSAYYYVEYDKPVVPVEVVKEKIRNNNMQKLKEIKRYFIPRFILDIFLIPRNISRFYRKRFGKKSGIKFYDVE